MDNVSLISINSFDNVNVAAEVLEKKLKLNPQSFANVKEAGVVKVEQTVQPAVSSEANADIVQAIPAVDSTTPVAEPSQAPTVNAENSESAQGAITAMPEITPPPVSEEKTEAEQPQVNVQEQVVQEEAKEEDNGLFKVIEGEIDAVKILAAEKAFNNIKIPNQMFETAFVRKEEAKEEVTEPVQAEQSAPVDNSLDEIKEQISEENVQIEESQPPLVDKEEGKPAINSEVTAILAKIAEEAKKAEEQNLARIKAKEEEEAARTKYQEQELRLNERQEEYEEEQKRLTQAKLDNEEQKQIGNQLRDNVNVAVDTLKGYTRQAINDTNEALNNTHRYNTETTDMKSKELELVEEINNTSQEREIVSIDTENKMKENELLGSALESINPYIQPVNIDEMEASRVKTYA